MTVSFTPRPAAAPARERIVAHARTETRLFLRNGEQLLLGLIIPVGILVGGRFLGDHVGLSYPTLAPSVLALAMWSTAFTSVAIATGFERRYGVLERLATTPLGRGGLLAGKAVAMTAIALGQVVVLTALALALGWRPDPSPAQWLVVALTVPLAVVAFASIALVLAGRLQTEVIIGLANLVYLVGLMGGAIIWPLADFPEWARPVVGAFPTAALGEALRHWSTGGTTWWTVGVAAAWAAGGLALARRLFTWTS